MTTRNEDLERGRALVEGALALAGQINGGYLMFEIRPDQALVLEPVITSKGKVWQAVACAWDRSGGLLDEVYQFHTFESNLGPWVKQWMNEQWEMDLEVEALLAQMPEEQ